MFTRTNVKSVSGLIRVKWETTMTPYALITHVSQDFRGGGSVLLIKSIAVYETAAIPYPVSCHSHLEGRLLPLASHLSYEIPTPQTNQTLAQMAKSNAKKRADMMAKEWWKSESTTQSINKLISRGCSTIRILDGGERLKKKAFVTQGLIIHCI